MTYHSLQRLLYVSPTPQSEPLSLLFLHYREERVPAS